MSVNEYEIDELTQKHLSDSTILWDLMISGDIR